MWKNSSINPFFNLVVELKEEEEEEEVNNNIDRIDGASKNFCRFVSLLWVSWDLECFISFLFSCFI